MDLNSEMTHLNLDNFFFSEGNQVTLDEASPSELDLILQDLNCVDPYFQTNYCSQSNLEPYRDTCRQVLESKENEIPAPKFYPNLDIKIEGCGPTSPGSWEDFSCKFKAETVMPKLTPDDASCASCVVERTQAGQVFPYTTWRQTGSDLQEGVRIKSEGVGQGTRFEQRREIRKAQNRRAAAKLREKKKREEAILKQNFKREADRRKLLEAEIARLRSVLTHYETLVKQHETVCTAFRPHSECTLGQEWFPTPSHNIPEPQIHSSAQFTAPRIQ